VTDLAAPVPGTVDPADAVEGVRFLDRELSWLNFNARVLSLAEEPSVPLLERAKFVALFSHNLDEFFMVRVAGLAGRVAAGLGAVAAEGPAPEKHLQEIRARAGELVARQAEVFRSQLAPALADAGIAIGDWESLDPADQNELTKVFEHRIFPVLTPLAVDPGHPFPYISNLSLNLAAIVRDPDGGQRRFARVKVPPLLPRFQAAGGGRCLVPLEQLIGAHLPMLFPGMEIESQYPFRVTRNADLTLVQEDADDLLAAVEMELRRRRFGRAVRLEVDAAMSEEVLDLLLRELELGTDDVDVIDGLLDLGSLSALHELPRPELKYEPWVPVTPRHLGAAEAADVLPAVRQRDVLLHHPYESFSAVEAFIQQAAADPDVLAIKQTLYRTSDDSSIARALIGAAERGKQVAVLVELTARFSEEVNIAWARALEQAGVHVVYGLVGLKTGCKTTLVVRREPDGLRRYCHIGTGNYDAQTARVYEDIGITTADDEIGADLSDLFNFITGYSRRGDYRKLIVAPLQLRERLLEMIREAAAEDRGRIVIKMNNLVDEEIITALYAASQAGCEIDLIIRGICRLRPETPGLSERIRVRSIVGRYLEHSRIFAFGGGRDGPVRHFIGSADLTPSNLDARVQLLCPVTDPELTGRLQEILDVNLADDVLAWRLHSDGHWTRIPTVEGTSTHDRLHQLAQRRIMAEGAAGDGHQS
jgi:polyphosphate kinase